MSPIPQEIPVLGEADLIAATISRRRKFLFIHGGIVPTHDKIGQKIGKYRSNKKILKQITYYEPIVYKYYTV